jgi:hypothetical protein
MLLWVGQEKGMKADEEEEGEGNDYIDVPGLLKMAKGCLYMEKEEGE